MSRFRVSMCWILALLCCCASCKSQSSTPTIKRAELTESRHRLTLYSDDYTLDKPYESMQGPGSKTDSFTLLSDQQDTSNILWIKSIKVDTETPQGHGGSNEFFCHANLRFAGAAPIHNTRFPERRHMPQRLLTLTEGRLEFTFPQGFGIPVHSDTALSLDTMTHQLNHDDSEPSPEIRFRTDIEFLDKNSENGIDLKPLFRRTLYVLDASKKASATDLAADDEFCGQGGDSFVRADRQGLDRIANNPIHWSVPPGEHTYELKVNDQLYLPFTTTLHYAVGHFHQYCDWLRLIDEDSGRVVVELTGASFSNKRGMKSISDFSSTQGLKLPASGNYILRTKYTNPTQEPIDAMAILYLYLLDENPR